MKTFEDNDISVSTDEHGRVVSYEELPRNEPKNYSKGRLLLMGGILGVVCAAFVLAAPELGLTSVVGGALAGLGSAGVTLLARR